MNGRRVIHLAHLSAFGRDQAQRHAANAYAESPAANKCSIMTGQQYDKEVVPNL